MQHVKTQQLTQQKNGNKLILIALGLIALVGVALLLANLLTRRTAPARSPGAATSISQADLEKEYGLRVNLVAVTALGGLVDVRLKIVDGEKARSLLEDPGNFPSLWIPDSGVSLAVPEEVSTQEILFENDGNLFVMFSNTGGIVKPGAPVEILFGDYKLEPLHAQ